MESDVTEIVLDFNTEIEPVSWLKVTKESGEEIGLKDLKVAPTQLSTETPARK